jgi:O-antigen/teichoic acid export membrane protein
MLQDIKRTAKNSIIYGVGFLLSRLVGFLLIPVYTNEKILTTQQYGIQSIIEISIFLLTTVFGIQISSGFFRLYPDKAYENKKNSIFFTSLVFLFVSGLLMLFLLFIFRNYLSIVLFESTKFSYLIVLLGIATFFEIIFQVPNVLIRIQEKPVLFTGSNLIRLVSSLSFTILFIVYYRRGVEGIYEAYILGQLTYFLMISRFSKRNLEFKFDKEVLKEMLSYCYPLAFSAIAGMILVTTDRYLIKFLKTLDDVAIYSLGFKIANTINFLVVASINLALSPILVKKMNDPNNKRFYSKTLTYTVFTVMFFVMGLSFFAKEIIMLTAQHQQYWISYKFVPYIAFGSIFFMLKDLVNIGILISKKTSKIAFVVITMSAINFVLDYFFIYFFSYTGAAIVYLIVYFVYFLWIYHISQKTYYIPYENLKLVKMILLGALLWLISWTLNDINLLLRIPLKLSLIISFPFVLYFLKFYEEAEVIAIRNGWQKWKNPKRWKDNLKNVKL